MLNKDQLMQQAAALAPEMVAVRRELHAHAETGFDLHDTLAIVKGKLEEMGLTPVPCGKAGFVVLLGGKHPGKTILLRADMDALPIEEASGEAFSCPNGRMHACGHDMHTALLLGAARLLKAHEDEIQGTVKLMFQPAEEIFCGSQDMIDAGVLKNPDVDAAVMMHVMAGMPIPSGCVLIMAPGVSAAAADVFTINIQGKGCHGSSPQSGVDPLNAAAHILLALQELNARELGTSDSAALTIGSMNGGTAANVIPDSAVMRGSLRTFDEETRAFLKQRIREVSEGTAAVFRAKAEVTFDSGCPSLYNDPALSADAEKYLGQLLGRGAIPVAQMQSAAGGKKVSGGGSEDFAAVSRQVPSLMLGLAAGEPDKGYAFPQHHPKVRFDESVLPVGAAVHTWMALSWLADHAGQ